MYYTSYIQGASHCKSYYMMVLYFLCILRRYNFQLPAMMQYDILVLSTGRYVIDELPVPGNLSSLQDSHTS